MEVSIMGKHNCDKSDLQECIRKKAYELWEKDGYKQGLDLDYWLIAEKTVKNSDEEIAAQNVEEWKQDGGWKNTHSVEAKNQGFFRRLGRS